MSAYSILRREKAKLETFWAVPANRNWVFIWIAVICAMAILTSDSFLGIDSYSEDDQHLHRASPDRYLRQGGSNKVKRDARDRTRRLDNVNHPITWLIYKLKIKTMLRHQTMANRWNKTVKVAKKEVTPENAVHLDELEDLLIEAYIQNNVTDPMQRLLMGLTNETVDMDDPRAIEYLRKQQTNVSVVPSANWRQHRLELSVLEAIGAFANDYMQETLDPISKWVTKYGKQTQVDIYDKYYAKDGFANKTFIQIGAQSRDACWECQIMRKPMVNWTGLVTEMNAFEVEDYLFAIAAPFCVAPATKPGIYINKRVGYQTWAPVNASDQRRWTKERAEKTPNLLSPLIYQSTLLPLADLDATLTEPVRNNYTHISLRPVQCYPLWTIMLANNISDVDYVTISTTGYAGKILETLPFDKIHPKLIHVTDLGDESNSTQKFLEERGFKLDANLTRVTNKDLHYGDFVFFKEGHKFGSTALSPKDEAVTHSNKLQ